MKTTFCALLLMVSMAFVLAGCTENSGPVEASADQAFSPGNTPSVLPKGGPVLHWASGNCGEVIDGGPVTFSLEAREYADGCSGEWVANLHGQPKEWGKMHGMVMSLKVYDYSGGKAAVIGGAFSDKLNVGYYFVFVVIDNGEGKNAPPDKYTRIVYFTDSQSAAEAVWGMEPADVVNAIVDLWNHQVEFDFVLAPIKWGNVQVR